MRWLVLLCACLFVSACKLEVISAENGSVESASGAYVCTADQPCLIDIYDTQFNELFKPVPEPGYAFTGWKRGDTAMCSGLQVDCPVSSARMQDTDELAAILASDDVSTLAASFAPHDRMTFNGEWFGQLLGSNQKYNSEKEVVLIEVLGDTLRVVETRWSERVTCELEGQFATTDPRALKAREAISGTFQCSPDKSGTFKGFIYAITDHQIVLEVTTKNAAGEKRTTVSALHRDNFVLSEAIYPAGEIKGIPMRTSDLGFYRGNRVKSGSRCAAFPAEDSHMEVTFNGTVSRLVVSTNVTGSENCEYTQTGIGKGTIKGYYQCDNGERGLWEGPKPTIHETPQGKLIAFETTRYGNVCADIHVIGWRKRELND